MLVEREHFVPYVGYLVFAVLQLNRYVAFAQGIFGNTMYLEVLRKIGQFLLHHYIQKIEIALAICKSRSLWAFVYNNVAGTGMTN
jgi:hypothetical protein